MHKSALVSMLIEEYYRSKRILLFNELTIKQNYIPGRIVIRDGKNGEEEMFLEWEENGEKKTRQFPADQFGAMTGKILEQRKLLKYNENIRKDIELIERAIGKEELEKYEPIYERELISVRKMFE